jgi:hypothetical protein
MSVNSPSLAQTQLNTIYAQVQSGSVESPEFPALNMGIANTLSKVNDWTIRHRPLAKFTLAEPPETRIEGNEKARCFLYFKMNARDVRCIPFDITRFHTVESLAEMSSHVFPLTASSFVDKPENEPTLSPLDLLFSQSGM